MRKNRALALLILSIISMSIILSISRSKFVFAATAEPKLERIYSEELIGYTGLNFEVGTIITVEYSVNRYVGVDSVIIVGQGSGLNIDTSVGLELNHSYNLQDRSYYSGVFNLTENTYFKAYGWIGEVTNGTYETVDPFNHLEDWHYLFINEFTPPQFDRIINATTTSVSGVYYAPLNKPNNTIVIRYRVYGGGENENITLAISPYRDQITDAAVSDFNGNVTFIKMDWANDSTSTYEIYNTTIVLTERTIYFCANNSFGWDSWGSDNVLRRNMNIYKINNGFHFESKTILNELHTDVDDINIKITSYNSTDGEIFGIGYYVTQSSTNDTEIQSWTMVDATLDNEYNETNDDNYNTTIREFLVSLGQFEIGRVVYFEAYNVYKGEYYNETTTNYHSVEIYTSVPQVTIGLKDGAFRSNAVVNFTYSIIYYRGNLTNILFDFGDGSPLENLTDSEDNWIIHDYAIDVTMEYTYTLHVNSSLGTYNSTSKVIHFEFTPPTLSLVRYTSNNSVIRDGYVELNFTYSDDYSGIGRVWINWGDGTILNVTGKNYAFHYYVESGNYTVEIIVVDKAGNSFSVFINQYTVKLPEFTRPEATPFGFSSIIIAFSLMIGIVYLRRRNR